MNVVTLIGNITRPVEIKQAGETTIANLSVAMNERVKKGDEWIDKPVFVEVTVFGKTATNCEKFLSQGSKVGISGRLDFQTWEDKESGKKRSKLSVIAGQVEFLTPKSAGTQDSATGSVSNSVGRSVESEPIDDEPPF